jgi:hypothetical protein
MQLFRDIAILFVGTAVITASARAQDMQELYEKAKAEKKEQQSKLDTWSPRKDVPPPAGLPPLFSLKLANNYPAFMSDTRKVADLRKRFEALTGPVQKKGGVR